MKFIFINFRRVSLGKAQIKINGQQFKDANIIGKRSGTNLNTLIKQLKTNRFHTPVDGVFETLN